MMTGMESEQAAEQPVRKLRGWGEGFYALFDLGFNRIAATLVVLPAHGDGITGCAAFELETDVGILRDTAAE